MLAIRCWVGTELGPPATPHHPHPAFANKIAARDPFPRRPASASWRQTPLSPICSETSFWAALPLTTSSPQVSRPSHPSASSAGKPPPLVTSPAPLLSYLLLHSPRPPAPGLSELPAKAQPQQDKHRIAARAAASTAWTWSVIRAWMDQTNPSGNPASLASHVTSGKSPDPLTSVC